MNPAHAAIHAAAVRSHRFVDVWIRVLSSDEWRLVRGEEERGADVSRLPGYATTFAEDVDLVHLMVEDFPGGAAARPDRGWQVKFTDGRVRPLNGTAQIADTAGLFLRAELGPEIAPDI